MDWKWARERESRVNNRSEREREKVRDREKEWVKVRVSDNGWESDSRKVSRVGVFLVHTHTSVRVPAHASIILSWRNDVINSARCTVGHGMQGCIKMIDTQGSKVFLSDDHSHKIVTHRFLYYYLFGVVCLSVFLCVCVYFSVLQTSNSSIRWWIIQLPVD